MSSRAQCSLTATVSASGSNMVYAYTLSASGCTNPQQIGLQVPQAYSVLASSPNGMCPLQYLSVASTADYGLGAVCPSAPAAPGLPLTFTLSVPNTTGSVNAEYTITGGGGAFLGGGEVAVPSNSGPPPVASSASSVDLLVGAGSHIAASIPVDYTTISNTTLASNGVGRAVPVLLAGLGFTFAPLKTKKQNAIVVVPNTAFVNLQFPTTSTSGAGPIDGYTFGMGYKVQTFLEVMVGYSLTPEMEPSYGFRVAAAQTVTGNPTVPIYQRYSAAAILANQPNALDGFPLLLQTASGQQGGPIYSGTVLQTHYRGGLFVGVAFPFSLLPNLHNGQ